MDTLGKRLGAVERAQQSTNNKWAIIREVAIAAVAIVVLLMKVS